MNCIRRGRYTSNSGNTITYDYDKLDRLVEKAYTDAQGGENGAPVAYAYNALGERVAMYDSTGIPNIPTTAWDGSSP